MKKNNRWWALGWIFIAELFALSVWFSGTAVAQNLRQFYHNPMIGTAWITISVQAGFILGAVVSAYFALSDRISAKRIFVVSALIAAITNISLIEIHNGWVGLSLRAITGIALAGVYPPAVKILSGFFQKQKGLAIGILIGGLTIGSNLPHFILFMTRNFDWKTLIVASSVMAVFAALIVQFTIPEKKSENIQIVSFHHLRNIFNNQKVMLSNYGYFGHMWELYAAWTWLPVFLVATAKTQEVGSMSAFVTIGACGALGCVLGGWVADRIGRARLTIIAMGISGVCALTIGFTAHVSWGLTVFVAALWGVSVIADSAQFSASVAEHAVKEYIGTALAFQMAIGYFITTVSIYLLPVIEHGVTWTYAFDFLALGPLFGIIAMARLQSIQSKSGENVLN